MTEQYEHPRNVERIRRQMESDRMRFQGLEQYDLHPVYRGSGPYNPPNPEDESRLREALAPLRKYPLDPTPERKTPRMSNIDEKISTALRKRHDEEELERRLQMADEFGKDTHENGTVLRWKKSYGGENVYTFAALKADGNWYVTGPSHGRVFNWLELVAFVLQTVPVSASDVEVMTSGAALYSASA